MSECPKPTKDTEVVKRYANRKLYLSSAGGYISYTEVLDLVFRDNKKVIIWDMDLKEDLTEFCFRSMLSTMLSRMPFKKERILELLKECYLSGHRLSSTTFSAVINKKKPAPRLKKAVDIVAKRRLQGLDLSFLNSD